MSKAATAVLPERGDPPLGLPRWLFWDVNPANLDLEKNIAYVVERIVEQGGLSEWKTMLRHYGEARVRDVVTGLRYLSPRSISFCCVALKLQPSEFRCSTARPFPPAPWIS